MKAAFSTLGCKVHQYESQAMSEQLQQAGFTIVPPEEPADIYIINSCTVTAVSDRKTRQNVRRYKRSHPGAIVVLTGCMPQAYPEAAEGLEEADIVISNANNADLLDLIGKFQLEQTRQVQIARHQPGEPIAPGRVSKPVGRTRAFVKIEDGCNRYCSYCIIPTARGRVRSKPLDALEQEVSALAETGVAEIVIVGITLSDYGRVSGDSLSGAVDLACSIPGIRRVRLGSMEPDQIGDDIIAALAAQDKFCPHFHLSLQSGCDATLKRMNRHYSTQEYRTLCRKLRGAFPGCCITTDIMVGFPGETQAEFAESLQFVRDIAFEKVHVFPYSPRAGTKAAEWEQLPKQVKEERSREMLAAAQEIRNNYLSSRIGETDTVLVEQRLKTGCYEGYTPNYTPVLIESVRDISGEICDVLITGADGDACYGSVVSVSSSTAKID
ncbi:MAG: tRNA (N(6)-L-threonylcarbamoyladenosine(37)-C(2))-methylthiotransferase MtaB [Clostridiales bacterium]|nr:tRNA (N(6)-L-threonylcarbamoyladenosine(37)-C(2))-methylthiotransferase MtaB [Clostridiales bacterium]